MYNNVQDNLFEGLLTAALNEFVAEELASAPSDEELAKEYPISQKMLKYYRRKAKQKNLKSPLALVYLKRVAVILLITVSVAFGILMTSEDVRAAVVETFVTWYEKFVEFDFSKLSEQQSNTDKDSETAETISDMSELEIGYIPSRFNLDSSEEGKSFREYIYTSEDGEYLLIGIYESTVTQIVSDVELAEYSLIEINKNDAYIIQHEEGDLSMIFGNSKYCVLITGVVEKDEAIKIAENIK